MAGKIVDEAIVQELRQNRFRDPIVVVATGFGLGWIPVAPGTAASLAAGAAYWLLISPLLYWMQAVATTLICAVSLLVLMLLVRKYGYADARCVVLDEIAGVSVAFLFLPFDFWVFVVAFLLFRLFDIWKPMPIGWIDRKMCSAVGILMDDLVAGGMACVIALAAWKIAVET